MGFVSRKMDFLQGGFEVKIADRKLPLLVHEEWNRIYLEFKNVKITSENA